MALFRRRPRIEKLVQRGDTAKLIAALSFHDRTVTQAGREVDLGVKIRSEAARALGEMGDQAALPPLVEALSTETDPTVLRTIVLVLQHSFDAPVLEALVDAVCSWQRERYQRARLAALNHLREVPLELTSVVATALVERRRNEPLGEEERRALHDILGKRAARGSAAASAFVELLASEDEGVARRAKEALVELAPLGRDELVAGLNDEIVAAAVAEVFALRPDGKATDLLVDLLQSEDARARRTAATALGSLGDPVAAEALLAAVNDPDPEVRVAAAEAVDKLGSIAVIVSVGNVLRPVMGALRGETTSPAIAAPQDLQLNAGAGTADDAGAEDREQEEPPSPIDEPDDDLREAVEEEVETAEEVEDVPAANEEFVEGYADYAAPPHIDEHANHAASRNGDDDRWHAEERLGNLDRIESTNTRLRDLEEEFERQRMRLEELEQERTREHERLEELERENARLREFELDNARLKSIVAEQALANRTLEESNRPSP